MEEVTVVHCTLQTRTPTMAPTTSTPSPLLDLFNPHTTPRATSGPTYVHIKSTPLQSATPLISELLTSARNAGSNVVFVRSDSAARLDVSGVTVVRPYEDACRAEFDVDYSVGKRWSEVVLEAVRASTKPATIIIESLDSLLDIPSHAAGTSDVAQQIFKSDLLPILNALDNRSRFVFSSTITATSLQPESQSRLITLLSSRASSSSSPYLTVQVHPPATWRYVLAEYGSGLRPASTGSKVVQKLNGTGTDTVSAVRLRRTAAAHEEEQSEDEVGKIFDWDAPPWRVTDPRLWSILSRVEGRSHLAEGSWWLEEVDRLKGEQVEAVRASSAPSSASFDAVQNRITLADLLGPTPSSAANKRQEDERTISHRSRIGWGIITCESRGGGGGKDGTKYTEEVLGVVATSDRLRLVPLEMGYYRTGTYESKTTSNTAAEPHLPFNLSLTSEQKARRDQVELPFAPTERIYQGISQEQPDALVRGTTGQSTIYFEPDSADEEDEEDPDEDLDV